MYSDKIEKQLREDYADESQRRCHQCDKVLSLESLINGDALVQSFTGRVFCPLCFDEYRECQGL